MIADELSQDDIDALLGGLGDDDDAGGGDADDALSALTGDMDLGGDEAAAPAAAAPVAAASAPIDLPEFESEEIAEPSQDLESLLSNVNLNVKIRLGKTEMLIEEILKLKPGRVVQLDTMSGDPVDILVNNKVVAKGEVIVLNEAFCVRISEIYDTKDKILRQS